MFTPSTDDEFHAWLEAHPQGFVLNTDNPPSPAYTRLHLSTCHTLHDPIRKNFAGKDYLKKCSTDRAALEQFALDLLKVMPTPCGTCNPPATTSTRTNPTSRLSLSNPERAAQIWHILIAAARQRQTFTYKMISDLTGAFPAGLGVVLGHIMRHCERHALPPLTVLVVQSATGKPGEGLLTSHDHDADRERVFAHEWYQVRPPTPDDLAAP